MNDHNIFLKFLKESTMFFQNDETSQLDVLVPGHSAF